MLGAVGSGLHTHTQLTLAAPMHSNHTAHRRHRGTNVDATHPWVRRMSVCTVMYNHLGSSGFAGLCGLLHSLGVFKVTTQKVAQAVLQHVESATLFHIFEVPHSTVPLITLATCEADSIGCAKRRDEPLSYSEPRIEGGAATWGTRGKSVDSLASDSHTHRCWDGRTFRACPRTSIYTHYKSTATTSTSLSKFAPSS